MVKYNFQLKAYVGQVKLLIWFIGLVCLGLQKEVEEVKEVKYG